MSAFILVLVLMAGNGATSVVIEMPNSEVCRREMLYAKQRDSVADAFCIQRIK